jgi:hypothetical protein
MDEKLEDCIITFTDKHHYRGFGIEESDGERIETRIPELRLGEKIVLSAYGSFDGGHSEQQYRRRHGIYDVINKSFTEGGPPIQYVMQEVERLSRDTIAHLALSGRIAELERKIRGLRYIALEKEGELRE